MNSTYMFDFLNKQERKHLLACFIILKAFQVFLGRVALTSNNDFHYFIGLKTINMPPFPCFLPAKRERTKKENGHERILRYEKTKTREKYLNLAISGYCEIIY